MPDVMGWRAEDGSDSVRAANALTAGGLMTPTLRRSLAYLAGVSLTCASLCLATGPALAATPAGEGRAVTPAGEGRAVTPAGEGRAVTPAGEGRAGTQATGVADLAVSVTGTTLAATTAGKDANVTVVNHGPDAATGVVVAFDLADLATDKVRFEVPAGEACRTRGAVVSCDVIDLDDGQALDLGVRLTRAGGTGDAGTVTVSVSHDGFDDDPATDAVTAPVAIAGSGPDLFVYAPDAPFDPETNRTGAVPAGGTTKLRYAVGNVGDAAVAGVRVVIKLPRRVTFAETEPGCAYDRGRTQATCAYPKLPIVPADADTSGDDQVYSMVSFYSLVTVSDGAPAPGRLGGGEVSVQPLPAGSPGATAGDARAAVSTLPGNAVGGSARRPGAPPADDKGTGAGGAGDVDVSDNSDEFVVYVAAPAVPAAPAAPAAPGGAGGLPITGPQPARTATAGLASVLVGVLLLLVGRRRGPATAAGSRSPARRAGPNTPS